MNGNFSTLNQLCDRIANLGSDAMAMNFPVRAHVPQKSLAFAERQRLPNLLSYGTEGTHYVSPIAAIFLRRPRSRLLFEGRECIQGAKGGPYSLRPFCLARFTGAKNAEECKNALRESRHGLLVFPRSRTIGCPSRIQPWLVPPAALAIHLAIGQVYSFSVFKIPLTRLIGIAKPGPDDWTQSQVAWIFSLAIVMLGLSAALFGKWLETAGPRKAMFVAACCFALGFFISYFGAVSHQLWLLYFGYGIVGGVGLGLGYISPVSTLIKWFPDRPGLATGMAIVLVETLDKVSIEA
jgi:hypothetical protein